MSRKFSSTIVGRTLFRAVMREIRSLNADGKPCKLVGRIDTRQREWESFSGGQIRPLQPQSEVLLSLLPPGVKDAINKTERADGDLMPCHPFWLPKDDECKEGLPGEQLRAVVRGVFRSRTEASAEEAKRHEEDALAALREIGKQRTWGRETSNSVKDVGGVKVNVAATYQSGDPIQNYAQHVFCYRATVQNESKRAMRVVGHRWHVIDSNGQVMRSSPGKPHRSKLNDILDLLPGQGLEFYTDVSITSEHGTMCGSFHVVHIDDGTLLEAVAKPVALHAKLSQRKDAEHEVDEHEVCESERRLAVAAA